MSLVHVSALHITNTSTLNFTYVAGQEITLILYVGLTDFRANPCCKIEPLSKVQ